MDKSPLIKWKSAGAVVVDGEGRIALVAPKGSFGGYKWTYPKGRVEPGESDTSAALREVAEEAGLAAEITGDLGIYEGDFSHTHYFIARATGMAEQTDGEMVETRFVTPAEAFRLLDATPRDLKVLAQFNKIMEVR